MPGRKRQRHCFDSGCNTRYQWTKGAQPSFFALPKFLTVVNCLAFYNLASTVRTGNADTKEAVSSLLDACDAYTTETDIDKLIESGNLSLAEQKLHRISPEQSGYVAEKSDDRLIIYMAGYVARKFIYRNDCVQCKDLLFAKTK